MALRLPVRRTMASSRLRIIITTALLRWTLVLWLLARLRLALLDLWLRMLGL